MLDLSPPVAHKELPPLKNTTLTSESDLNKEPAHSHHNKESRIRNSLCDTSQLSPNKLKMHVKTIINHISPPSKGT